VINWKPVWRNPTQESMVNNQKFIMAAMKKAASGPDHTDKGQHGSFHDICFKLIFSYKSRYHGREGGRPENVCYRK